MASSVSNKNKEKEDWSHVVIPSDPKRVEDFGYKFNDDLCLENIETGEPFKWQGQKHYDAFNAVVLNHIQRKLVKTHGLLKVSIPLDAKDDEATSYIFVSPDLETNEDKLLLLIQGTGAVRAGQWARSVCINNSLKIGSILPFVERAIREGWSLIVFNPNLNSEKVAPDVSVDIRGSESAEDHAVYVHDNFVARSPAAKVSIIAHSYGGISTMTILEKRGTEFLPRLDRIALTDTLRNFDRYNLSEETMEYLSENVVNWVASKLPLDTPVSWKFTAHCRLVSSGHNEHEYTTGTAFNSIFEFLNTGEIPEPEVITEEESD